MTAQAYGEVAFKPEQAPEEETTGSVLVDEPTLVYDAARSERIKAIRDRRHQRLHGSGPGGEDSLGQYLHEIGAYELLTREDEVRLAQQIEAGRSARQEIQDGHTSRALRRAMRDGQNARDQFIRGNLRLVVNIAQKFPVPRSLELLDLIQEGNIGLGRAVDNFDWRMGFKFSTYATFLIRQAVGRGIDRTATLIYLPVAVPPQIRHALNAQTQRQGDSSGDDLPDDMGRVYRLMTPTSLDRPVDAADDDNDLGDALAASGPSTEELASTEIFLHEIRTHLDNAGLTDKQRRVIELRYLNTEEPDLSFREIAQQMGGVTPEAVRLNLNRAMAVFYEYLQQYNLLDNRGDL